MTGYSLGEIARITGARITGANIPDEPGIVIRHIHTDTRHIDRPGESLFIALKGPNHDGHQYINEAYLLGIRFFLAVNEPANTTDLAGAAFLLVPDTLVALQDLAAFHRSRFTGKLIAITGSNGKTIIKEWLSQILLSAYTVSKNPKSYNSQLGVPLSVLGISPDHDFAVLEAGISLPGEMDKLQNILRPQFGLITNIGSAHQENFPDLAAKVREKLNLFKSCERIYCCKDHDLIFAELVSGGYAVRLTTWSRETDKADLFVNGEKPSGTGTWINGRFRDQKVDLLIPFRDPASIENILHIWLLLLDLGFDRETIAREVLKLEPIRMRLEQKSGINGCTLVNDYYNSDIQSIKIALDLLFRQTTQEKKTLILSDILQTGVAEEQLYLDINKLLDNRPLYRFIGIGPAIYRNRHLFPFKSRFFLSTRQFIDEFKLDDFSREAILLKGARSFEFESISRLLEERIHATILEIRMNDVRHNLSIYRQLLKPGTRLMVMVKAFSYGSGGFEIARFLSNERIDYLGVAFTDEGIELRREGIRTPVMVMNPDFNQSELLVDYHLEPEIFNWSGLRLFADTVRRQGIPPYPIHLKIDTGMHRLGFQVSESDHLIEFLRNHQEIYIKSMFSHLAASEDPSQDRFTMHQIDQFTGVCDLFSSKMGYSFLRHILNSAGIERFPEAQFEMVRLGIGLYGFSSIGLEEVRPIATLRTTISQIHDLSAGESVGYGRLSVLAKSSRIAVIPIGYADGIDRRLGNGNYKMMIRDQYAPTTGNICMDMTMLDVTGLDDVNEGDEVIVFGPRNSASVMASILGTIPYEIITSVPERVKRIYLFE